MKIIHIDRQNSWTGQTNRLLQKVVGLRARGHYAEVVTPPGSQLSIRCREAGVPVITLPMRGWKFNVTIVRLVRHLRAIRPDIVHCHGPRDHLLAFIACRLAGVPHLIRTKHNHTRLKSGVFSRYLYNRCTKVITVSEFIRRRLIEDGLAPDHVETIYTAVNLERFTPRSKNRQLLQDLGLDEEGLIIGCLSSLHVRKGIEELLKAFKIILDSRPGLSITCLLIGKKWQRWSSLAEQLGIRDRVVLTGFREDVPELLSLFDIYALPSRDEGLGTSILEALAMGLPVVVSNAGGITEAVGEDAGLVVPPGDPDLLAETISLLIDHPERRRELSHNGRERAEKIFSVEVMINRTRDLYERLVAAGA
jgi:glycosyltransferase involved in cell wall biosynthesis